MNEMRLRNQKLDLFGRSVVLNVSAIVVNLAAVVLVVMGFHEYNEGNAGTFKVLGFSLLAISLFGLVILRGLYLYSFVARALVGGLFIVSGLVKANDPLGFAFKLEEYFAPNGLTYDYPFFDWFVGLELPLSIIICVAEIVLGVAVILGGKIKLASWSLVIMMGFFTWLTWYTTSCNESQLAAQAAGEQLSDRQCVIDCGCFGDALRGSVGRSLTPAESFWKDIVLFYFVLVIFFNQWKIKLNDVKQNWVMVPTSFIVVIFFSWVFGWLFPVFFTLFVVLGAVVVSNFNIGKIGKAWKMALFVGIISSIFATYTTMYLPIKDYRPYAIGNNIYEQMHNGVDEVVEVKLKYKNIKTGEYELFAVDEWETYMDTTRYVWDDNTDGDGGESDQVQEVIVEGVPHSIMDFLAEIDYEQLTEEEKKDPFIDSVIQANYETYYDEMIVVKGPYGNDTMSTMDYDPAYYPDSIYTAGKPFVQLMDPSSRFSIKLNDYIFKAENMFLMTIMKIDEVSASHIADFKEIYESAVADGIPFFVLAPATEEQIAEFKQKHNFGATFLTFDATEVKILVRSNPGLLFLQKGTIMDKWPCRSVADYEDIKEEFFADLKVETEE